MNDLAAQFRDAPPVLPQATRLRGHLPLAGVRNPSPAVHLLAYAIDDGSVLVLLLRCGEIFPVTEHQGNRFGGILAFLWFWDGRDELGGASAFDDLLCRVPGFVQFPMATGVLVRRVQDRRLKEWVAQDVASRKMSSARPTSWSDSGELTIGMGIRLFANVADFRSVGGDVFPFFLPDTPSP